MLKWYLILRIFRVCFKSILQCHTERSEVSQYMPEILDSSLRQMLCITFLAWDNLYFIRLLNNPLELIEKLISKQIRNDY